MPVSRTPGSARLPAIAVEEQGHELAFPQQVCQLPKGEVGKERDKCDQALGKQCIPALMSEVVKPVIQTFPFQDSAQRVLDYFKQPYPHGENRRISQSRKDQRAIFGMPAQLKCASQEDDFSQNQRFDQGDAVMIIADLILRQD